MAERQGLPDDNITISAVIVVVKIAATETCAVDCYLDFGCFWRGECASFLHV